jgi:hypothetical protein
VFSSLLLTRMNRSDNLNHALMCLGSSFIRISFSLVNSLFQSLYCSLSLCS